MKSLLGCTTLLLLTACAGTSPRNTDATVPRTFTCESGQHIVSSYPTTETATVEYKGQTLTMQIAVSASGARYVNDTLEWWTKGNEGTLFNHNADGTSGDIVESCTLAP